MRLIDADAIDEVISTLNEQGWNITRNEYKLIGNVLFEFPTIEAEPVKHGRWVKTGQSFIFPEKFRNYFCSECLFEIDRKSIRTEYLYCPICGAKMDEVEE